MFRCNSQHGKLENRMDLIISFFVWEGWSLGGDGGSDGNPTTTVVLPYLT